MIIDMHVHAFDDSSGFAPMLGQPTETMDGGSVTAPTSMEAVRKATFAKFEQHNIVKAVLSVGGDA